jgi:N-acetylmuramoyl-L-alanine amidase
MKRKLILIDPGHGGIDPITEQYTTAPHKMARHPGEQMHNNGWFYEGAWNRFFALELGAALAASGIPFLYTTPFERWHEDVSLGERISYANWLHQLHDLLFISIHANAHDTTVRGWQVHTSPGETRSDAIGQQLWDEVQQEFGGMITMRSDVSDGDADFENKFKVLTQTRCTAILAENLFFDNTEDALLLINADFVERLKWCYFRVCAGWVKL